VKTNFFLLLLFVTREIIKIHLKTFIPKLILALLLFVFVLNRLYLTPVFLSNQFVFYIIIALSCALLLPLFVALEESLHMGVCIQQGKSHFIQGVAITYAFIRNKHRIFIKRATANFYGNFTLEEKIQIHSAAPCLILILMGIIYLLIVSSTRLPTEYLILLAIILFISPILNLVPSKSDKTDGYFIIQCAQQLQLSTLQTIKQILHGMFLALRYVFLGTLNVRKYKAKLKSASESVEKGNFEKALSILEKEAKNRPNDPELCNNIAWCYAELGNNLDRAITMAKMAIELDSGEAIYYDTLGWCYYKNSNFDRARECIIKAIKIDSNNEIFQKHLTAIEDAKKQST
jgi:hypothetical protein